MTPEPKAIILNTDDDTLKRSLRTSILTDAGYQVVEARTGQEALTLAERTSPDLLLLDVMLPDINGFEVAKRIKSNPATANIPILHLSGIAVDSAAVTQGLADGADAYLTEPVDTSVLLAHIKALLRLRRMDQELRQAHQSAQAHVEQLEVLLEEVKVAQEDLKQRNENQKMLLAQLGESEQRFRTAVDSFPHVYVLYGPDLRIRFINKAGITKSGLSEAQIVGRRDDEIFPAAVTDAYLPYLQQALETGTPQTFESTYTLPTGTTTIHVNYVPLLNEKGEVYQILGIATDITERRQTEEELLAERSHWRGVVEGIADEVWVCDAQGRMSLINLGTVTAMGLEEFKDKPVEEVLERVEILNPDGQVRPVEQSPLLRSLRGEIARGEEIMRHRVTGKVRYRQFSSAPTRDATGAITGAVAIVRDITERKQMEEALRESEDDLNRAQAVAQTGSWRLNVRRNELLWSMETYRIFGIPQDTPLTYDSFLSAVHPEDREYVDRKWRAALQGAEYDIEHRIVVGDTVKWVREKAELEFDVEGALLGGFGTVQDITSLKAAEEEREQLLRDLERQSALLELVLRYIPAGLIVRELPSGKLIATNQLAAEILGLKEISMDPITPAGWQVGIRSDGSPYFSNEWPLAKSVREEQAVANEEISLTRGDGIPIIINTTSALVYASGGNAIAAITVFYDITERKHAEAERERLLEVETRHREWLETLNSEISHRVKNNLAMAAGLLQLQIAGAKDPSITSALNEAATRLLTFAGIHETMSTTAEAAVDLLDVLGHVADANRAIFAARQVDIAITGNTLLLPHKGATNICVAVNEMITNAIKYGAPEPDGWQRVKMHLETKDEKLQLSVWNSGTPISSDFDPTVSAGLGLKLVLSLMHQYNGSFTLQPAENGTLASILLEISNLQQ